MARGELPSAWLVGLQFGLIAALLLGAWPPESNPVPVATWVLLGTAAAIGVAAIAANRPGNFNIQPEPKAGARLVTAGIYRWIRHPMYCAVLLAMLATVFTAPRPWRWTLWLALLAVLVAKLLREERYLLQRFPTYAPYRHRTWRLVPWLW